MHDISVPAAHLFGIYLDLLFCGLYICIYGATIWITRHKYKWYQPAILAIHVSFLLNIARTGCFMAVGYLGFVRHIGANGYFESPNSYAPLDRFDRATGVIISDIAYATLTWRLFIIWSNSYKVIILPVILWVINAVGSAIVVAAVVDPTILGSHENFVAVAGITYGLELILNWLLTALIAGKLWWAGRRTMAREGQNYTPYTRIIIAFMESGFMFSVGTGVLVVLGAINSNGTATIWYCFPKIVGMIPTVIVLQLNLGYTQPGDSVSPSARTNTNIHFESPHTRQTGYSSNVSASIPRFRSRGGVVSFSTPMSPLASSGGESSSTEAKDIDIEAQTPVDRETKAVEISEEQAGATRSFVRVSFSASPEPPRRD